MKVADLKNELKLRNLPTTGKRDELLKRLQNAIAQGVEREEDIDEEAILAGDDEGDDDGLTPMEEEAVLAPKATPARASRRSVVAAATPATPARGTPPRPALKRTAAANLVVPEVEEPAPEPNKATPAKTPAKEPAGPPAKVAKVETPKPAADEANKENGQPEKTAAEKRAERFGIVSEDTAKAKRADRFGIVSDDLAKKKREERFGVVEKNESKALKKAKMTSEPVDVEKIKARAERFGTTTSSALDAEKKKARLDRFGDNKSANGTTKDVTSDEAKAARAEKFAPEPVAPVISASGKTLITFGTEDSAKQARAARFAGAK